MKVSPEVFESSSFALAPIKFLCAVVCCCSVPVLALAFLGFFTARGESRLDVYSSIGIAFRAFIYSGSLWMLIDIRNALRKRSG